MPTIALGWDPGTAVPRSPEELLEVERMITQILERSPVKIGLEKIIHTAKGIKLTLETEQCIENTQSDQIKSLFKNQLKLSFIPSRERMAKTTLSIRPFNVAFFDYDDEQILAAIRRAASLTEDAKIILWKDKKLKLIKLTFESHSIAESVKRNGFRVGTWTFTSRSIWYAQHFQILQCMKCFEYETHSTKNCKSKVITCSECASHSHTFRNCPNPRPGRCVNCLKKGNDANHRTLANNCPEKRKIVNRKRNEKEENENLKTHLPIAKAVSKMIVEKSTVPEKGNRRWEVPRTKSVDSLVSLFEQATPKSTKPEKKKTLFTKNLTTNILVCSINAHMHNKTYPGTFSKRLKELLKRNGIPEVDLGDDWDSPAILEAMWEMDLSEMEAESTVMRTPGSEKSPKYPLESTALEVEDSEEDMITPEKKKKRKKKKKNTKQRSITLSSFIDLSPLREPRDEDTITDEETEEENEVESSTQTTLEEEEEDVETKAKKIFEQDREPTDEERMILYLYFKNVYEEKTKLDLEDWKTEDILYGIAYWSIVPDERNKQNQDFRLELKARAKTGKEVNRAEVDHNLHWMLTTTGQDRGRIKELLNKENLTEQEREELNSRYDDSIQDHILWAKEADLACMLMLCRKKGLKFTREEYRSYKASRKKAEPIYEFSLRSSLNDTSDF